MSEPDAAARLLVAGLTDIIPPIMRQNHIPGLNLALALNGRVIWEQGFGLADLDRKTPMDAGTVTRAGSMAKLYTGVAVMQLVERGVLGLDDPINAHLFEFKMTNPLGAREITVRDLLTHHSGLTGDAAGSDFKLPRPLGEHLRWQLNRPMLPGYSGTVLPLWSAKVGEKYEYSNLGFGALGYLVENLNPEGLSFSDYVQTHILEPLGMGSSQLPPAQDARHLRPEIRERLSTGYAMYGGVHVPTPAVHFATYPAGGLVATPGDHVRLLLALQNEGSFAGRRLLKPESVRQMLTPQASTTGKRAIGLAVHLNQLAVDESTFGHNGSHMYGWSATSIACPGLDFALVVATNQWDMVSPAKHYIAGDQIGRYVTAWLKRERSAAHRPVPPASWPWKVSYVVGLSMVEQLVGILGPESPLETSAVAEMAAGGRDLTGGVLWDEDGFRAGVRDMLAVEMTPSGIQSFLESERLGVRLEELEVIYAEIGVTAGRLLPSFAF
jgi:CubicO group peptidase (beta-lactamase class C family)